MSIYKGTQLISGVATPVETGRNIGQIIQSLLPITDAGLHLLDGTVISGDGIYSSFVNYIKGLDLTASYFCSESEWQTNIEQYGVCGKFVYDASANTVRLPKVTGHVEGTLDPNALGDLLEAGLPDHNHSVAYYVGSAQGGSAVDRMGYNNTNSAVLTTNASQSNPIYGNSETVQTQSILGYMYIVLATGTKTDIEVDIDNVVTDLNGKVDVSSMVEIDNASSVITNMAMPDNSGIITITLPYTAPCDGWVWVTVDGSLNGYNGVNITANSKSFSLIATANAQTGYATAMAPVPKGAEITNVLASGTISRYFIPCKGAN